MYRRHGAAAVADPRVPDSDAHTGRADRKPSTLWAFKAATQTGGPGCRLFADAGYFTHNGVSSLPVVGIQGVTF